jgi:hypothetical protein
VGLERGPLNVVSTAEELLQIKSSGSGLENLDYGCRGSASLTKRHSVSEKKLIQLLTEMSIRNRKIMFLGSRVRPVRRATTLPPSVSRLSRQCGTLNISQPYRLPRSVSGRALFYGDGVCFL